MAGPWVRLARTAGVLLGVLLRFRGGLVLMLAAFSALTASALPNLLTVLGYFSAFNAFALLVKESASRFLSHLLLHERLILLCFYNFFHQAHLDDWGGQGSENAHGRTPEFPPGLQRKCPTETMLFTGYQVFIKEQIRYFLRGNMFIHNTYQILLQGFPFLLIGEKHQGSVA